MKSFPDWYSTLQLGPPPTYPQLKLSGQPDSAFQFLLLTQAFWKESVISTFFYPPYLVAPKFTPTLLPFKPIPGFPALPAHAPGTALSWVTVSCEQFPGESHIHLWCRTGKRWTGHAHLKQRVSQGQFG